MHDRLCAILVFFPPFYIFLTREGFGRKETVSGSCCTYATYCRSSSGGGQKRGERGEREKGMGGGRGPAAKRGSTREMSKEREAAIRVSKRNSF